MIGEFKLEAPENIFTDAFICLRSKAYSFTYGADNKMD